MLLYSILLSAPLAYRFFSSSVHLNISARLEVLKYSSNDIIFFVTLYNPKMFIAWSYLPIQPSQRVLLPSLIHSVTDARRPFTVLIHHTFSWCPHYMEWHLFNTWKTFIHFLSFGQILSTSQLQNFQYLLI